MNARLLAVKPESGRSLWCHRALHVRGKMRTDKSLPPRGNNSGPPRRSGVTKRPRIHGHPQTHARALSFSKLRLHKSVRAETRLVQGSQKKTLQLPSSQDWPNTRHLIITESTQLASGWIFGLKKFLAMEYSQTFRSLVPYHPILTSQKNERLLQSTLATNSSLSAFNLGLSVTWLYSDRLGSHSLSKLTLKKKNQVYLKILQSTFDITK